MLLGGSSPSATINMLKTSAPISRAVLRFALALVLAVPAVAADWPNFRGAAHNGHTPEVVWKAGPLKQLWSLEVGEGYSAVAVVGPRAYTMGWSGGKDHIFCLDAATGKQIWRYSYPCEKGDYSGPRATPAVTGGRVYTLSRLGQAYCLNAANGRVIWNANIQRETGAQPPQWGYASSALVHGDHVYYNVGTAGTALERRTGRLAWKSGGGKSGYATPVPYTINGQEGIAVFTAAALVGVRPDNGRPIWRFPWSTRYDINSADPVVKGDRIFISSNYGKGGAVIRVDGNQVHQIWQNRNMKNHTNPSVWLGGFIYGNDENTLRCIDAATGAMKWGERGIGKGAVSASGNNLLVFTERGELWLVEGSASRFNLLAQHNLGRGSWWTAPTPANGRIYCRSHEGTVVCLAAQ